MEETTPDNPKEYVRINGVWQYTNMAWFVDKDKLNSPVMQVPNYNAQAALSMTYTATNVPYMNHQCVAHVHHWKTALEEYCRVDEKWLCVRCADEVPSAIQSMIKLYRPLKDI